MLRIWELAVLRGREQVVELVLSDFLADKFNLWVF